MNRETAIGIVADRLENHRSTQRWDMGGRWEKAEAIVDALGIGQEQDSLREIRRSTELGKMHDEIAQQGMVTIAIWRDDEGFLNAQAYQTREGAERDFPDQSETSIVRSTVQP